MVKMDRHAPTPTTRRGGKSETRDKTQPCEFKPRYTYNKYTISKLNI